MPKSYTPSELAELAGVDPKVVYNARYCDKENPQRSIVSGTAAGTLRQYMQDHGIAWQHVVPSPRGATRVFAPAPEKTAPDLPTRRAPAVVFGRPTPAAIEKFLEEDKAPALHAVVFACEEAASPEPAIVPGSRSNELVTCSGRIIDICSPRAEDIDIEDIAHALSHICRWCGHSRAYYSVAQHSVLVSQHVPDEYALWGLLHDAAEAYLMDLPTPIKRLLPGYHALESKMQAVIAQHFGLPDACPQEVHEVDKRLQVTEAIELGLRPHLWGGLSVEPLPIVIAPRSPELARSAFMRRFAEVSFR